MRPFLFLFFVLALLSLACGLPPTPTPEPAMDVMQAIGATQTAAALLLPTNTFTAIFTETLVLLPTDTATSAPTIEAPTLAPAATLTQVVIPPTLAPSAGVCSCSGDSLNCSDFSSHTRAQACFDYCVSVGAGDIHRLDNNGDGDACEGL